MSDDESRQSDTPKKGGKHSDLQEQVRQLQSRLQEMERLAHHDVLTGLPNRRYFIKSLENRVARCLRYGDNSALLFLDVNNLKKINDTHGHGAGDLALSHLGQLLSNHVRQTDFVARIGGDEFGILLDNLDADEVERKIAALLDRISNSEIQHRETALNLRVAIGYCFVGPRDTVTDLLSRADAAMYANKDSEE
ncbi:MAG: GGDEF domain-containing protein [Pseudomonadota bacterium]